MYKGNSFDITSDQMQYWYHTAPTAGGSTCGVYGNDPDYQAEISPNDIVEDGIFFSALLTSDAVVTVQIGSSPAVSYSGLAGINHWSQPFNGHTGSPVFSIIRNGVVVSDATGTPITASTTLSNGCTNYNAWVGSFQGPGLNLP
jgi:glucan endo-1,3-alpha-glucosidase